MVEKGLPKEMRNSAAQGEGFDVCGWISLLVSQVEG